MAKLLASESKSGRSSWMDRSRGTADWSCRFRDRLQEAAAVMGCGVEVTKTGRISEVSARRPISVGLLPSGRPIGLVGQSADEAPSACARLFREAVQHAVD